MTREKIKTSLIFIFITFLTSCGFKAIGLSNNDSIYIQNIEVMGDRRITNIIKNDILLISNKDSKNKYKINVRLRKNKTNKIKDSRGKVIRHTITLNANLDLKNVNNKTTISKEFSRSLDYNVQRNHSDTINNENSATKNIVQQISDDLVNIIILSAKTR